MLDRLNFPSGEFFLQCCLLYRNGESKEAAHRERSGSQGPGQTRPAPLPRALPAFALN